MALRSGRKGVRKDQVDFYGRIKDSGGGASVDDFVDTDTIIASEDTESGKIRFDIAADVNAKIENSLQTPLTTPTELELVGIDTDKSQKRIGIGKGLLVEENNLVRDIYILRNGVYDGDNTVTYSNIDISRIRNLCDLYIELPAMSTEYTDIEQQIIPLVYIVRENGIMLNYATYSWGGDPVESGQPEIINNTLNFYLVV